MPEVTVVGGGIAGLTAAITAAQHGARVRVLEERAELGGRARTSPLPYRANLGPHALYSDGAFWRWLDEAGLLPATVSRGQTVLTYRSQGELIDQPPTLRAAIARILSQRPGGDVSFRQWMRTLVGDEAADILAALAFIPTYDPDAGQLSAAFVSERLRRAVQPGVAHYVVGGWGTLVSRLAEHATSLGVAIETKNKVVRLPPAPVIVATSAASAERLLPGAELRARETRVGLLDVAIEGSNDIPASLLDIDERLYWAATQLSIDPSLHQA